MATLKKAISHQRQFLIVHRTFSLSYFRNTSDTRDHFPLNAWISRGIILSKEKPITKDGFFYSVK